MPGWRTSRQADNRWYMGVTCRHCDEPILFAQDRSDGNGPIARWTRLVLTCSDAECGQRGDYSGAPISRYQKGNDMSTTLRTKVNS